MISSPGVGGREIDVPVLARKLIAQGHPTWVMCRPGTLVERLSLTWQLPVILTNMKWYFDPADIISLVRFLKKERIQIIHAHWSKDLSNLILASKLAGNIPVILTKHVYATEDKHDVFHRWVYRNTPFVIAISDLVAKNIEKTVRVPARRIETIYNGIELEKQWNPEQVHQEDLRSTFGVPAGKPILGYVGRLNRGKGPHHILEAFSKIAFRHPDWHFVLVGKAVGENEEKYAAELKSKLEHLGLAARVHFTGYRTDMPAVMHTFDILANASEFESLGMVVVEAMAMERPVIGPDTGGVPEIIESGKCGYLYPYNNNTVMAEKLEKLMTTDSERLAMGKAGREIVLEKFNLDLMAKSVADVFRRVLSAG
ncbi:glycosyltransferase family 4 protein [bacterium]|nr:glycosyltransferase family 4 protein [bacterium]